MPNTSEQLAIILVAPSIDRSVAPVVDKVAVKYKVFATDAPVEPLAVHVENRELELEVSRVLHIVGQAAVVGLLSSALFGGHSPVSRHGSSSRLAGSVMFVFGILWRSVQFHRIVAAEIIYTAELHILDQMLCILLILLVKLETARHKPCHLAVRRGLGDKWLDRSTFWRHESSLFLPQLFDAVAPLPLEYFERRVVLKTGIRANDRETLFALIERIGRVCGAPFSDCTLRALVARWKPIPALNVHADVVLLDLLLGPVTNVVSDISPVTKAIQLTSVDKQELFISAPVVAEYGICLLLDHLVVVPCTVIADLRACAEARAAEVKVFAATRASDAHG